MPEQDPREALVHAIDAALDDFALARRFASLETCIALARALALDVEALERGAPVVDVVAALQCMRRLAVAPPPPREPPKPRRPPVAWRKFLLR